MKYSFSTLFALAITATAGEDPGIDAKVSLHHKNSTNCTLRARVAGEDPSIDSFVSEFHPKKTKTCTDESPGITVSIQGEDPIKGSNVSTKKRRPKTTESTSPVTTTSVSITTTLLPSVQTIWELTKITRSESSIQSTAQPDVLSSSPTTIPPPPPTTVPSTTTTLQQTPLPQSSLPPRALDTCYDYTMNVQKGKAPSSCGAAFYRISYCYNASEPWSGSNLYASEQNEAFRSCACMLASDTTFDEKSNDMYKFWTGCLRCVSAANGVNGDEVSLIIDQIPLLDNFCRAELPDRYLFVSSLSSFFSSVDATASITVPPLADVTPVVSSLSSLYTTTPPLANLAYGTNASPNGSLAGVTPSLTTFTSYGAAITSLVTWVPTAGGTYDPVAASKSAESAALSALSASWTSETHGSQPTACYGRGPCHRDGAVVDAMPGLGFALGAFGFVVGVLILVL